MGLKEALGSGPVALDSALFIYLLEDHEAYREKVTPLFEAIDRGLLSAVTSAITLLEVMVVPYREGNSALASKYENLLRNSRGITLLDLDLPLLRLAAQLRAQTNVRTPDALQMAAGLAAGCTNFLTNDRRLPTVVGGMRVIQLKENGLW